MVHYPRVDIRFCTKCRWNLRAAWYLQELLSTFGNDLGEVAMAPAESGVFQVYLQVSAASAEILLWDRKQHGMFPDSKDLKQLVRDVIAPAKDLGHSDRKPAAVVDSGSGPTASNSAPPEYRDKDQENLGAHSSQAQAPTTKSVPVTTGDGSNRGTGNHGSGNDGNNNYGNDNIGNNNHGSNNHGNNNRGDYNHGNNNVGNGNHGNNNHGNNNNGNNNNGNNNEGDNHNGDNHKGTAVAAQTERSWPEECVECNAL